jgi:hypothetical protein
MLVLGDFFKYPRMLSHLSSLLVHNEGEDGFTVLDSCNKHAVNLTS